MKHSKNPSTDSFTIFSIMPFLIITFGIAWGIIALYLFLPDQMASIFGQLTGEHPLFYLATYGPAIAALTIVLYKTGLKGTKRFLSRLLMWRAPAVWYLFLILVVPAPFYIGAAIKGLPLTEMFPVSSLGAYLVTLFLFAIKGPVEEIGWRGFALPLLQRKMSPLWAALLIGIIWGFWHLPAFLLSGTPQSAWSFSDFFVGTIALSIIATALYNASRGSILLPALFHLQVNNPLWPDAQPYDTIPFVVLAILVIWFNRETILKKDSGVTSILPPIKSKEDETKGVKNKQPVSPEP
ncbi:CPBP family intramembrane glutamic endopeptidase [Fodinibius sp. SL11]|uniref:CPBP family intramembrane glutamic endopeptidase n=1 Tax=Fodinibius sp. SL11 TaxID=3425690 RepID=UPI003F885D00